MGPGRVVRRERLTVAAGRFTLLCVMWPAAAVLQYEVAQAGPLPLRASLRDTRGSEELHLFGLLPLEGLLPSLRNLSMQKSFMEALPDDWALPKFSPSAAVELLELQTWLSKVKKHINFDTLRNKLEPLSSASIKGESSVMQELLSAVLEPPLGVASTPGGANFLLSGTDLQSALPSVLKEFMASLPLQSFPTPEDTLRRGSGLSEAFLRKVQLLQRLPSLDQLDIGRFVEIFAFPSDIEWPVERRRLALLLPIITSAEDGGLLTSPFTTLVERNGLTGITIETAKMLLPLAQPDGLLLFAKLKEIFPHMALPQTLTMLPLATLKNTELSTVDALWSALKSTLLPRQAIMSADTSFTLTGPVLNLTNLAKLSLVSSESLRKQFLTYLQPSSETMENSHSAAATTGDDSGNEELLKAFAEALESGFPLEDTLKSVFTELSTELQQALLPFEGLSALDGTLSATRFKRLYEWRGDWEHISAAEFRDDLFFRLQLPVIALSRDSIANAFRQLQRLPAPCDSASGHGTCALGLTLASPATREELEDSVVTLSRRVETLAEQLKGLLYQLQINVSELVASTGATAGSNRNKTSAAEHILSRETGNATDHQNFSASPLRDVFSAAPSSPNNVKEPEGWRDDGPLFALPNTFSRYGKHSKINTSTLQQALDASVKLCDTLTVVLRYTKNEVKSMRLFNGHASSSGRNGNQGAGINRPASTYFSGYESWESPDLGSLTNGVEDTDSRRRPFLVNIHGSALAALPRTVLDGTILEPEETETARGEFARSRAPWELQRQTEQDKKFEGDGRMNDRKRRLQATQEDGALATKQLVLLDPLALGKLLFAHSDGADLLEKLKKGIVTATRAAPRLERKVKDGHEATSEASFPPILEDLFDSNALSFPAFTLPGAELLRAGVFPKFLLQAPIEEWVSPMMHLPTEAGKYAVLELLQLHSLASQLKNLSLEDLLSGESSGVISTLNINSDLLRHKLGDLHLKSLIPSQLADLPLQELLRLPEKGVLEPNEVPEGSRALSLEKLLALDAATAALLTQPFGDVLGLKDVLEDLTLKQFRLPPALTGDEVPAENSGQLLKPLQHALVADRLPTLSGNPLAAVGVGEAAGVLSGDNNIIDLSSQKWLAPGSSSTAVDKKPPGDIFTRVQKLTGSSFLPGKSLSEGTQHLEPSSLANLAEGLRSHRPMTDIFRHLWNTAGVTSANELYF